MGDAGIRPLEWHVISGRSHSRNNSDNDKSNASNSRNVTRSDPNRPFIWISEFGVSPSGSQILSPGRLQRAQNEEKEEKQESYGPPRKRLKSGSVEEPEERRDSLDEVETSVHARPKSPRTSDALMLDGLYTQFLLLKDAFSERPGRENVPYLTNRPGRTASKFPAVEHNRFALMGVNTRFDCGQLYEFYNNRFLLQKKFIEIKDRRLWEKVFERMHDFRDRIWALNGSLRYAIAPVLGLREILILDRNVLNYFSELSALETTARFLIEVSDKKELVNSGESEEDAFNHLMRSIAADVSREALLSALLVIERSGPDPRIKGDEKSFQDSLIASLITLYDKCDLDAARCAFRSWLDITRPGHRGAGDRQEKDDRQSDRRAERVIDRAMKNFRKFYRSRFSEEDNSKTEAFGREILEEFFSSVSEQVDASTIGRELSSLLTDTGLQKEK